MDKTQDQLLTCDQHGEVLHVMVQENLKSVG